MEPYREQLEWIQHDLEDGNIPLRTGVSPELLVCTRTRSKITST